MKLNDKQKLSVPKEFIEIMPDKTAGIEIFNTMSNINESSSAKLSAQEKDDLSKFIEKSDDVEEIKTFIAGLKSRSVNEDVEESRSFYDKLPQDIQIYLDEFDGPWIDYGELLGGKIFYEDEYDTYTWNNIEEFISDMRYNIRQIAEEYSQAPEDYDYTEEFEKVLQQSLLTEDLDTDLDDTELEIYLMNLI